MIKVFLFFSIFLFFSGCSVHKELLRDSGKEKLIVQQTKKGEIVNLLETKAHIFATYLNRLDAKTYSDGEYFFINTFFVDDFEKRERRGLNNPFFELMLKDKKGQNIKSPTLVELLHRDSEIVKEYGINSRWGENFLVRFDRQDTQRLYLNLMHKDYGGVELRFSKDEIEY